LDKNKDLSDKQVKLKSNQIYQILLLHHQDFSDSINLLHT
jgi:hypothetical protein